MDETALSNDWRALAACLPADLEGSARQHRFIRRSTGRQDAETLLRLILMHAAGGLSLSQTSARARARGWAHTSSVALHKRLRASGPWLEALTRHLLSEQRRVLDEMPALKGKVLRIVDATDIQEPGSTGTDWRLHYSLRLPDLACDHFELTDARGAERASRFSMAPGEVILADRGYCRRGDVAQVLDAQADVVVRLAPSNFPLQDDQGKAFNVLAFCRGMAVSQRRECSVWFEHGGWVRPLRLCVLRKTEAATQETQRKLRRRSTRNQSTLKEVTLESATYVLILTSLPAKEWSTAQILELYRCRWQIELAFKRLKTLLHAGHVPKSSDSTARAWLQAKVLTALLVETLLSDSRSFSPSGASLD